MVTPNAVAHNESALAIWLVFHMVYFVGSEHTASHFINSWHRNYLLLPGDVARLALVGEFCVNFICPHFGAFHFSFRYVWLCRRVLQELRCASQRY